MRKVWVVVAIAWLATGCSSESDGGGDSTAGSGGAAGSLGAGGAAGATSGAGAGGSSATGSGAGAGGSSAGGSSAGGAGGATSGGSGGSSAAPSDGSMYAMCSSDDDCGAGLNCYENGGYCSTACADDADCTSLGANFSCSMGGGGGGGGFPGGGMNDGGGAAEPTGVCRAVCDGAGDTSCPSGLTCMEGFGGGGGMPGGGMADGGTTSGTGRCGYEDMTPAGGGGDAGAQDGGFPGFPGGFMPGG